MTKLIVRALLVFAAVAALAQDSAQVAKPATVCVAQIRNQTPVSFDLAKLRETYVGEMRALQLSKSGAVNFITIEVESSDNATEAIQKTGCEFAIYTRILQRQKTQVAAPLTGTTYQMSKNDKPALDTFGIQCTVERTLSGMPILIDRQFDDTPGSGDKPVLKLLTAEAARIEAALEKKLPLASQK